MPRSAFPPVAAGGPHFRAATRRPRPSPGLGSVLAVVLAATVTGCSAGASPSFDRTSPCASDARVAGAYPELEALVPRRFDGRGPDRLDSGRNCTDANLGSLTQHGIRELRFAGGLWQLSSTSGLTLAVFKADGLTAPLLGEWYESSARDARNTSQITPTRPTVRGQQAYRLDTLNGDSRQTVIVWPAATGEVVDVVLAADVPEDLIQAGIESFD